jgi:hypothetical protein
LESWKTKDKNPKKLFEDLFELSCQGKARIIADNFTELLDLNIPYCVEDARTDLCRIVKTNEVYELDSDNIRVGVQYMIKRIQSGEQEILELSEEVYILEGREEFKEMPQLPVGKPRIRKIEGLIGSVYKEDNKNHYFINLISIDDTAEITLLQILDNTPNLKKPTTVVETEN